MTILSAPAAQRCSRRAILLTGSVRLGPMTVIIVGAPTPRGRWQAPEAETPRVCAPPAPAGAEPLGWRSSPALSRVRSRVRGRNRRGRARRRLRGGARRGARRDEAADPARGDRRGRNDPDSPNGRLIAAARRRPTLAPHESRDHRPRLRRAAARGRVRRGGPRRRRRRRRPRARSRALAAGRSRVEDVARRAPRRDRRPPPADDRPGARSPTATRS